MAMISRVLASPLRVKAHKTKTIATAPNSPAMADQIKNLPTSDARFMSHSTPIHAFTQAAARAI
jgi:hypothetical protein